MTDKRSLNDLSDYNPRGGKAVRRESNTSSDERSFKRGRGGGGKGKAKGSNRPGKEARNQKRASSKSA